MPIPGTAGWQKQVEESDWPSLAALPWIGTPEASVHHRLLAKIFEDHVVITDSKNTLHVCKSYDAIQRQLQEVKRGEILINRRLALLTRYFDEIESKKRLYIKTKYHIGNYLH